MMRWTRTVRGLALVLPVVALLVAGGLWFGETARVWWTARTYLQAVVNLDCERAATVSVWRVTPGTPCTSQSMGFAELTAPYEIRVGRVTRGDVQLGQAGVAVRFSGNNGYDLHLILREGRWIVDGIDVATSGTMGS